MKLAEHREEYRKHTSATNRIYLHPQFKSSGLALSYQVLLYSSTHYCF